MRRTVALTRAREQDIPFIVHLLKENGLPFTDIREKRESLFLVESKGAAVGIGGVELLGEYGLLRSLAVVEEERNKGYGRAVVGELMNHARKTGVKEVYLLTTTATPFFEGLGFERIERASAPQSITETSEFSSL